MTSDINLDASGGPFDRCLQCPNLGNGCSGPRTNAMQFDRYIQWLRELRELRRKQGVSVSIAAISDATGLSKNTVDNLFAGRTKDISRATAGMIEDHLIGGNAKWPCAMDLNANKDVVYQDRPETLEALAKCNRDMENIHQSYQAELDTVRAESQRKVDHLLRQIEDMREMVALLRRENEHKAALIDRVTSHDKA